jgi:tetratricopeptide (TPR) repeat protein
MQSDRINQLRELFESALGLERDARRAYVDKACVGDASLRGELESLIAAAEATVGHSDLLADGRIDLQRAEIDRILEQAEAATITHASAKVPHAGPTGIPQQIGRYRIVRAIASGGMGTVYEAEQQSPKRTVALKVIKQGLATPALLRRFELESQVLGKLQHPGIAQIYEAGTHREQSRDHEGADTVAVPFFAMEYVHGVDLRRYVSDKKLDTRARLDLIARICDAVHHAHQKGVIHRDLKPGNILVDASGQPKILDFGVARATDSDVQVTTMQTDVGQLIGTLQYMSPEQVAADPNEIDTRSDVYALGVIAYEILTGRPPYDLKNKMIHEAARIIREDELTRLSTVNRTLRGDVETIVGKALEKEKDRRYPSAAGLAEDIRRYLADEPITARPPSAIYQLQKFARRNRALAAGLVVAMAALLIGTITSTYMYMQAENARQRESEQRQIAENRADELETVTEFQRSMIWNINAEQMGRRVVRALREDISSAMSRAGAESEIEKALTTFDELVGRANATNLALTVIDENVLESAAEAIQRDFVDQPLTRAALQQAISDTYRELGLHDRAMPLQEACLKTRREELGEIHADVSESLNGLGMLHDYLGDFDQAEQIYREVLAMRRALYGDEHREVTSAMGNLAIIIQDKGDLDRAEQMFREILATNRRLIGKDDLDLSDNIRDLALVLGEKGDLPAAEALHREGLAMVRRLEGDEHEEVAARLNDLAITLQRLGKIDESERLQRESLAMTRRFQGDEHPKVALHLNNLAYLLQGEGKLKEAEPLYREALKIRRKLFTDDHPDMLVSLNNLARVLCDQSKFDQAILLFEEAVSTGEKVHPSHWRLGAFKGYYGACLTQMQRFSEAEAQLLKSHELLSDALGSDHRRTTTVQESLAALYDAWHAAEPGEGYDAKAAEWRAKLPARGAPETSAP